MRPIILSRALIVVVAAVLALTTAAVTPAAAQDQPLLARGSTGEAVEQWQDRLNDWLQVARTEQGRLATDGIYGPLTEAATRDFQDAAGITVDGIVGPETRTALEDALSDDVGGGDSDELSLLNLGDTGSAVARWQEDLNTVLDPDIATDGIYGPVTRETTVDFQQAAGIAVDGIVGPETRGAMETALEEGLDTGGTPPDEGAGDEGLNADEVLDPDIDTADDTGDASGDPVAVTDVAVGSHDGFDRVTFAIGGDGQAGWEIGYVTDPTAQGSGQPVEVDGEAVLQVRLTNIALPTDPPEGTPWDPEETIELPGAGPIAEVLSGTTFEGTQTFYLGVHEQERPFQVRRFSDPQRVVVDVAS